MGFASTVDFLDETCRDAFGDSAVWTPFGGAAQTITGIFDRKYYEAGEAGCTVDIGNPVFSCLAADISDMLTGDTLVYENDTYDIIGIEPPVQSDSQGWVDLELERHS